MQNQVQRLAFSWPIPHLRVDAAAEESVALVPMPAERATPVAEPYDFDRCTIQIGLQLLPEDGDLAGRAVLIGVHNHADAPVVAPTLANGPPTKSNSKCQDNSRNML